MQVRVFHWHYNDGWRNIPRVLQEKYGGRDKEFDEDLIGWHCWAYPDDDGEFEAWMKANMKGEYDCTRRFNSGDPMTTVIIRNDEDATLFKLRWNPAPDRFGGHGSR